MELDLSAFETVKRNGEELYKSLSEIHCPYFNEKVYFNAKGLEHLKFKTRSGMSYKKTAASGLFDRCLVTAY